MDSASLRQGKHGVSLLSLEAADLTYGDGGTRPTTKPVALETAARSGVAASAPGRTSQSSHSARARLAYGLLQAAMDDSLLIAEVNHGRLASQWTGLQAGAVEAVHAGARSAIELMEALAVAEGPRQAVAAQMTYTRQQREALTGQIMDYLAAARNIMAILTTAPFDRGVGCAKEAGCPAAPCTSQTVIERLRGLTERQKRVLELMAEGLPNKLIAYELGLSETTVKAHVSAILRKLCVYSRARAIVLLANIDLASISGDKPGEKSGGR